MLKRFLTTVVLLASASATEATAAPRCGWLENPSTANWWVTDKDGMWILATQGQPETKGSDLIPDFADTEFVTTYASHGYGCACVEASFNADKVATVIYAVHKLPLSRCRTDRSLPKPGQ